ncbi:MAG: response regulator [Marivita sp. XM-24bin2]|nr:MAG: response regulator [Marivita sp. XM-24bin2]
MNEYGLDHLRRPTTTRPLLGLTILAVEDSLYACDALRLLCLHSGARLRRADCLQSARRHLRVYRPSVAIVDMNLPDGSGADLIAELATTVPRVPVILGCSGDSFAEDVAYAAGAEGFLEKPFANIGTFQQEILKHLPPDFQPAGIRPIRTDLVEPDPVAFREDMAHIADILGGPLDAKTIRYVTAFLHGVAVFAEDGVLSRAASELALAQEDGTPLIGPMSRLAGLVQDRVRDAVAI